MKVTGASTDRPTVTVTALYQDGSPPSPSNDFSSPGPPPVSSRVLVSEMMILAGEAAGAFGAARGLPLPYRSQPTPTLPSAAELAALPEGPCRLVALRSRMTKSATAIVPAPHAALGLEHYVQARGGV